MLHSMQILFFWAKAMNLEWFIIDEATIANKSTAPKKYTFVQNLTKTVIIIICVVALNLSGI